MEDCILRIPAPICLADGNEYDIAIEATVTFTASCNGCGTAEAATIHDVTPSSIAMEFAGIAMPLDFDTEEKIARSWLLGSRKFIEGLCCDAFNGESHPYIASRVS